MTEPADFLSRWSQRKRDARLETAKSETAKHESITEAGDQPRRDQVGAIGAGQEALPQPTTPTPTDDAKPADVFDLSKLPSLDSIGPATDIRAFMQPGVPDALSRAALRRAWSADPGIRDFIGLAENAWDFTANDSVHGFGALDPADAKRLLAELFSEHDSKDDKESESDSPVALPDSAEKDVDVGQHAASDPDSTSHDEAIAADPVPDASDGLDTADDQATDFVASQHVQSSAAPQQMQTESPREVSPPMARGHGRALPH